MRWTTLSSLSALTGWSLVRAAPVTDTGPEPATVFPVVDRWLQQDDRQPACNSQNIKIRKDFDTMAPAERKAYTTAVNCLRRQPSQLDPHMYPAATNRFADYAVVHVNRTRTVHLDGFFLTWHRYFLWLYERDLEELCHYSGSFPYWNWPATADNLTGSAIFSGDEFSMSGDGVYTGDAPVILAPGFSLPHGTGGGCIQSGPFQGMNTTMADVPIDIILTGQSLPATAFQLNETCLTRDLNAYAARTWCNRTDLAVALQATSVAQFSQEINGILGGTQLGLHSGAHFIMGGQASSLFVSPQDPIWYALHAMLDHVYTSWQLRHPHLAHQLFGTHTALNIPPSSNVTLDSLHPDWGYFESRPITVHDLISTTAGPFCYRYD